jgi:hypothetical protein
MDLWKIRLGVVCDPERPMTPGLEVEGEEATSGSSSSSAAIVLFSALLAGAAFPLHSTHGESFIGEVESCGMERHRGGKFRDKAGRGGRGGEGDNENGDVFVVSNEVSDVGTWPLAGGRSGVAEARV